MTNPNRRLAILGAGNMAGALLRGALDAGIVIPGDVVATRGPSDPLDDLHALGVAASHDNVAACQNADVVILGIKPQQLGLVSGLPVSGLLVSILAGVTTGALEAAFPAARVIRVMPNTPALVGQGMAAFCRGTAATDDDAAYTAAWLESVGRVIEVKEALIDPVTATSGSGPAYVFLLAEAMQQGAEALGLSPTDARLLASQTLLGAATLLDRSEDDAATLRQKVTSKGGTTAAALGVFADGDFSGLVTRAMAAADARAKELGS